jgi:hypothetical protein
VRAGVRFVAEVYPFVEGQSSGWGEWTAEGRAGML